MSGGMAGVDSTSTSDVGRGLEPAGASFPKAIEGVGKGRMGLLWSPDFQAIHCDGRIFHNDGGTATQPSHDLAHLLIAANGELLWHPIGDDHQRRIAEYNAVFLEVFLATCFQVTRGLAFRPQDVLTHTIEYMRWFVGVYYAPFPLQAEEAYRQFCWGISPSTVSRLSPLFFHVSKLEADDPTFREKTLEITFSRADTPLAVGPARGFADLAGGLLSQIAR
jgi:hypothetical protein